jgi:hypothetical protein
MKNGMFHSCVSLAEGNWTIEVPQVLGGTEKIAGWWELSRKILENPHLFQGMITTGGSAPAIPNLCAWNSSTKPLKDTKRTNSLKSLSCSQRFVVDYRMVLPHQNIKLLNIVISTIRQLNAIWLSWGPHPVCSFPWLDLMLHKPLKWDHMATLTSWNGWNDLKCSFSWGAIAIAV